MPWHLDDWISDAGADVLEKRQSTGSPLSAVESLVYEVWLLDTEARNGGLSQYFGNHGLEQWRSLVSWVAASSIPSFAPFQARVEQLIEGTGNPSRTIQEQGDEAENLWYGYQPDVIAEVRREFSSAP